jgi:CxxC-x17-CxxC domain-containing protein
MMRDNNGGRGRDSGRSFGRNNSGGSRGGNSGGFGGGGNFGGGRRFNDAPREMHKVTCSECSVECEVPFKPTEGKPVYCRNCYAKHKPQRF